MTAYLINFLLGALVGAAGTYLENRFTDLAGQQANARAALRHHVEIGLCGV